MPSAYGAEPWSGGLATELSQGAPGWRGVGWRAPRGRRGGTVAAGFLVGRCWRPRRHLACRIVWRTGAASW